MPDEERENMRDETRRRVLFMRHLELKCSETSAAACRDADAPE